MAYSSKSAFVLISLVLSIYIMRNTDVSPGSVFSHALRSLASSTTGVSFCAEVDINAPFSSQQTKEAQAVQDSVKTLRGGNKLLDYLKEGNKEAADYIKPLIPVIVPWAVMLIISLLCCFSLYGNWCYLHGCCKNRSICSCCKAPKHQTRLKLFVTLSSIFLVCTLGASIAGLVFSRQVAPGIKRTFCSAMSLAGDLEYGASDKKWIGVKPAINSIDDLLTDFNSTVDSLNSLSDPQPVSTACQDGKTEIANFITAQQGQEAHRAAADHSAETYKPDYIANIGPATTNTTSAGMIQAEFELYNGTVFIAQTNAGSSIDTVKAMQDDIYGSIIDAKGKAVEIDDSVYDVYSKILDNQDHVESAITGLNIGLLVFFLVFLVLSALSVFAIIFLVKFRVKVFSKFLHLSWCLFIILTLLGFILCGVLYTGSIVAAEGCDSANVLLGDSALFTNVITVYVQNEDSAAAVSVLEACLFEQNGNILSQFDLTTSLASFYTIYTALDAVNTLFPTGIPTTSKVIALQKDIVTSMRDGLLPDSANTANDLMALNVATNKDSNPCTAVQDTWLLNSANCTSSQGMQFASGYSNTYNILQPTCIGFDAWGTVTDHQSSIRYGGNEFPSSCSNIGGMTASNYVIDSVTGFQNNRVEVKNILNNILDGSGSGLPPSSPNLNTINQKFINMMGAISGPVTELAGVKSKLQDIEASLIGPETGLITNAQCTWVKGSVQLVVGSACVELLSGIYFTSVMIIIMSVMSLFSAMWLFVLLKRVNLPKYEMAKTFSPAV